MFSRWVMPDSLWPYELQHHASPTFTIFWSLPKLMSIESVVPSNHLIFCHPLLLPSSIFPSIRVFSNEPILCIRWPKYWSFSISTSSSSEYSGLISLRLTDLIRLIKPVNLKNSKMQIINLATVGEDVEQPWLLPIYCRIRIVATLCKTLKWSEVKVTQLCPTHCDPMAIYSMGFSRPEYKSG